MPGRYVTSLTLIEFNHQVHDILYLHGFGQTNPERCPVAHALRIARPTVIIHAPCYHPGGRVAATRIGDSLKAFATIVGRSTSGKVHVVGYSFGGLLAAILAAERPDIVANVLLLAPAIDNYARNFESRDPDSWHMPRQYVEELQGYPARPDIVRPTTLVHGMLDDDGKGSAPWRVQRWAGEQTFHGVHLLDGVDHSLEPWLSAPSRTDDRTGNVPTFRQLVMQLTS